MIHTHTHTHTHTHRIKFESMNNNKKLSAAKRTSQAGEIQFSNYLFYGFRCMSLAAATAATATATKTTIKTQKIETLFRHLSRISFAIARKRRRSQGERIVCLQQPKKPSHDVPYILFYNIYGNIKQASDCCRRRCLPVCVCVRFKRIISNEYKIYIYFHLLYFFSFFSAIVDVVVAVLLKLKNRTRLCI